MKKLFLILMLVAGLMIGGAGGCVSQTGMRPDVQSMPNVKYDSHDFFGDDNPYFIPFHIKVKEPIWLPSTERLTDNILLGYFTSEDKQITFVVNDKKMIILALIYRYTNIVDNKGETTEEFYIYDGKPYPVKVTGLEMKAYLDVQKQFGDI